MIRRSSLALAVVALLGAVVAPVSAAEPLEQRQWGLRQIHAPAAWSVTRGAGVTVAIVDSGVDLDHPEFAGRVVGGATFTGCADRSDGCGDGDVFSGEDLAPSSHGTHVAGIALAADDGSGTTGVAPEADLLAVKVLRGDGEGNTTGTSSEIAAGIRWAVRNGADVINLSLGELAGTQALHIVGLVEEVDEAIDEAVAAGVVVIAAAGNDFGVPACSEPAFDPDVLCVIATQRNEQRAAYSNLGVDQGLRVVSAPGGAAVLTCEEDVLSTFATGTEGPCPDLPAGYGYLAGTSMAAPHVSGVAALLLAAGAPRDQVFDRLQQTARNPVTGARGMYDPMYGFGIVDADEAVGTVAAGATLVTRHAGSDRVRTAVAISQETFGAAADSVVLARADAYADALAGAPLAAMHGAPLLLSHRDRLSQATEDEIERLGADTAYLLGGESALSSEVAADLRDAGVRVVRLHGPNRYATAASVASALPSRELVYVVEGANPDPRRGWPDALSASGIAATFVEPILLTERDRLPPESANAIDDGTDVIIIGGTASVGPAVETELRERAASVRRVEGADRYATSAAVAREAVDRGASPSGVWIATGRDFPDGLAAGAAAGNIGGLFVLVDGRDLDGSPSSRDFLAARADAIDHARLAGGTSAISADVEDRLRDLLG